MGETESLETKMPRQDLPPRLPKVPKLSYLVWPQTNVLKAVENRDRKKWNYIAWQKLGQSCTLRSFVCRCALRNSASRDGKKTMEYPGQSWKLLLAEMEVARRFGNPGC